MKGVCTIFTDCHRHPATTDISNNQLSGPIPFPGQVLSTFASRHSQAPPIATTIMPSTCTAQIFVDFVSSPGPCIAQLTKVRRISSVLVDHDIITAGTAHDCEQFKTQVHKTLPVKSIGLFSWRDRYSFDPSVVSRLCNLLYRRIDRALRCHDHHPPGRFSDPNLCSRRKGEAKARVRLLSAQRLS